MTSQKVDSEATLLCKSCGLCCSGHLFAWVKLRSPEVKYAQALGLPVLGTHPKQRGFNQPCPLWNGQCTIYDSPHYPRACKTYQCQLLKKLLEESTTLSDALAVVQQSKDKIRELQLHLPASSNCNFRERLVAYMESEDADAEVKQKVIELLTCYQDDFGVKDVLDHLEER